MRKQNITGVKAIKNSCLSCSMIDYCLSCGLDRSELPEFDNIVNRSRIYAKGDSLLMPGQRFAGLYIIHSGSVKAYVTSADGEQQVVGFYFPGELIGTDGICLGQHNITVVALETTSICEISYTHFESLSKRMPELWSKFIKSMSHDIVAQHGVMLMLGKMTADQRFAQFLLDISSRNKVRGHSTLEFNLSMTRYDIGNYLGLAVETVSRLFTKFQEQGVLQVNRRKISLNNVDALRTVLDRDLVKFIAIDNIA